MVKKSKLKELAEKEARKLKKHATAKEIKKLNMSTFSAFSTCDCIYGQMTGNCNSARANELIEKCAERVYNVANSSDPKLNGAPYHINSNNDTRHLHYLSPIEMVIFGKYGGYKAAEKIMEFLKGETKTIHL